MKNQFRSKEFIKVKHCINNCKRQIQLVGCSRMMMRIKNNAEYLVLMQYYEAKQAELNLDDLTFAIDPRETFPVHLLEGKIKTNKKNIDPLVGS